MLNLAPLLVYSINNNYLVIWMKHFMLSWEANENWIVLWKCVLNLFDNIRVYFFFCFVSFFFNQQIIAFIDFYNMTFSLSIFYILLLIITILRLTLDKYKWWHAQITLYLILTNRHIINSWCLTFHFKTLFYSEVNKSVVNINIF